MSILSEVAAKRNGKGKRRASVKLSDRILRIVYIGLLLGVLAVGGFVISTLVKGNSEPRSQEERDVVFYADMVKKNPKNLQVRMQLGKAYLGAQNYELALSTFNDILKSNPKSIDALVAIGGTYQAMGEQDKAINKMKEVLKTEPKNEIALWVLAKASHDKGDDTQALDFAKKLEASSPSNLDAYFLVGQIYEKRGEKSLAKTEYQKILQFDPESNEAKTAILRLGLGK